MRESFEQRKRRKNYEALLEEVQRCERLVARSSNLDKAGRTLDRIDGELEGADVTPEHRYEIERKLGFARDKLEAAHDRQAKQKREDAADTEHMRLIGALKRLERGVERGEDPASLKLEMARFQDRLSSKGVVLKRKHAEGLRERFHELVGKFTEAQAELRRRQRQQKQDVDYIQLVGMINRVDRLARVSIDWEAITRALDEVRAAVTKSQLIQRDADSIVKRIKNTAELAERRRKQVDERRQERKAEQAYARLVGAVRRFEWLAGGARNPALARAEYEKLSKRFAGTQLRKEDAEELKERLGKALALLDQRTKEAARPTPKAAPKPTAPAAPRAGDVDALIARLDAWIRSAEQFVKNRAAQPPAAEARLRHEIETLRATVRGARETFSAEQQRSVLEQINRATALLAKLDKAAAPAAAAKPRERAVGVTAESADAIPPEEMRLDVAVSRLEKLIETTADWAVAYEEVETLHWSLQEARGVSGSVLDAFRARVARAAERIKERRAEEVEKLAVAAQNTFAELRTHVTKSLRKWLHQDDLDLAFERIHELSDKVYDTEPLEEAKRGALIALIEQALGTLHERIEEYEEAEQLRKVAHDDDKEQAIRADIMRRMNAIAAVDASINEDEAEIAVLTVKLNEWRPGTRQKDYRGAVRAQLDLLLKSVDDRRAEIDRMNHDVLAIESKLDSPLLPPGWTDW